MESVLVDRSETRFFCHPEDGVFDVGPHNHRDLRRNCILDADCRQVGLVLSICLVLGVGVGCDIRSNDPVFCDGCGGIYNGLFLDVALLDRDVGFLFCQRVWAFAAEPDHAIH